MKRHGDLWPKLIDFGNLVKAAEDAARGKRLKPNVLRFWLNLERQLCDLSEQLSLKTYRPGPYKTFLIHEPKQRLISAAPFRDRVIHHALTRILEPIFEPIFVADSYACRKGKGTHAAMKRFSTFAQRYRHVFQGDVRKYFPSIDHAILLDLVARKIKDKQVLWLVKMIVSNSNPQEPVDSWFAGDDLWTALERRRGLPLGNQTSQFFANVYLNPFDHFVKEVLKAPAYLRYVDDFTIFHDDPGWLAEARARCRDFLCQLRLQLHPQNRQSAGWTKGARFLGYRIFPGFRLLPKTNVTRMRRRLKGLAKGYATRAVDWPDIRRQLAGWWGHAAQADTWQLRQRLLREVQFKREELKSSFRGDGGSPVSFAAVPGTTIPGTAALLTATTTSPETATITSVSG